MKTETDQTPFFLFSLGAASVWTTLTTRRKKRRVRGSDEQFIFDESRPSNKSLSIPNADRKKDGEREDTIHVKRIRLLMGKQGD